MSQAAAPQAKLNRKLYAVLVLCAGIGLGSIQDVFLKDMSGRFPFHQLQSIRSLVALLILLAFVHHRLGLDVLRRFHSPVLIVRGLCLGTGSLLFYLGLSAMTMADATALYFALPLIMVVLSGAFLGEQVKPSHWIAAAIGFIGVAIMLKPGSGLFDSAALLPLAASVFYAFGNMTTRKIDINVPPLVTATYAAFSFLFVAGVLALVFGTGMFENESHKSLGFLTRGWVVPGLYETAVIFIVGVLTLGGFFCFAEAYRNAAPSFLGPFEYTSMVWAMTFGFVFFSEMPNLQTLAGSAVIVGAGLYITYFERSPKQLG